MRERIATWHKRRLWSKAQVANAVKKGVITVADYEGITGEVYKEGVD